MLNDDDTPNGSLYSDVLEVRIMEPRLDVEQKKPLTQEATIREKLEAYNARSLVWEDEERVVYLFDYSKSSGRSEIMNRHVLKKLKEKGHWNVIRHPLVLNFVNEKILSCTLFYVIHVVIYFVFLFLLYSYIQGPPTVAKNLCVTAIILFFVFFLLVKAALRLQSGSLSVSFWFAISYLFNILTYCVTLFYVWSFHFFNFDNYHEDVKQTVSWFLPIIAILSSWINCLYVLRKAPCGPYILMMSKILFSFLNTTIIWIPTLFCFAFSFQLVMRDSGREPWDIKESPKNATTSSMLMAMFQSFTKTSAMMIGEVEANDILERRAWIANLLLILFEIITVILLMNLMISLAVGDVNELRVNAQDRLLKIKVNFCIEALHLSEQVTLLDGFLGVQVLHRMLTNNVLVINKYNDDVFSARIPALKARFFENVTNTDSTQSPKASAERKPEAVYNLVINTTGLRLRKETLTNKAHLMSLQGMTLHLVETSPSGISPVTDSEQVRELEALQDHETSYRKFQRWIMGLNWKALLNI